MQLHRKALKACVNTNLCFMVEGVRQGESMCWNSCHFLSQGNVRPLPCYLSKLQHLQKMTGQLNVITSQYLMFLIRLKFLYINDGENFVQYSTCLSQTNKVSGT